MDFKKLSQKKLCEALGVAVRTVQRWGCPRNTDGSYSLPDVFKWRLKTQVAAGSSMAEIDRISAENLAEWRGEKAKLAALERRKIEGELMDAAGACREAASAGIAVRESFESLPVRLAPLLAAEDDSFECQKILDNEIYETLNRLANYFEWKAKNYEKENTDEP
jgi:phage terminase Nu1 subunit (DNA packaging protein)